MLILVSRVSVKLAVFLLFFSSVAGAQAQSVPAPYDSRDQNGIDRVTGRFALDMLEGGIGGDDGISMVRYYGAFGIDNWSGVLLRSSSGSTQYTTVILGKVSERFTKIGSVWVADKANGATLAEDVPGRSFTYRGRDGTTVVYKSPLEFATELSYAEMSAPQCNFYPNILPSGCAVPVSITRPNGKTYKLTWNTPQGCQFPNDGWGPIFPGPEDPPIPCTIWFRLSDVRNNSSFAMKVKYQSDTPPHPDNGSWPSATWHRRSTLKFLDLAQVYCDPAANNCDAVAGAWPTVSYANPSSGIEEIVNSQSGTWRIDTSSPRCLVPAFGGSD